MNARGIFLENTGLKLFSLLLAVLIWLTIRFSFDHGINRRDFGRLPVTVMKDAADTQTVRLIPSEVTVTVSGPPSVLDSLTSKDIQVFVNLTGLPIVSAWAQKVEVFTANRANVVGVDPPAVRVERIPVTPPSPPQSPAKP